MGFFPTLAPRLLTGQLGRLCLAFFSNVECLRNFPLRVLCNHRRIVDLRTSVSSLMQRGRMRVSLAADLLRVFGFCG